MEKPRPTASSPGSSQLLIPLFLGVLTAALDIAMIGPAIPAIQRYFAIGPRESTWIIGSFALFTLIGVPAVAWFADAYGKKRSFLASVSLFVVGAITCSAAPSMTVLLLGRVIQGVGAAGVFPVASAVVGDAVPRERRGRYLGILGSVFGVAFLFGPAASGVLLLFLGWRFLFLFAAPIGILALVLGLRSLPKDAHIAQARKLDVPGLLLLTLFVGALSFGLNGIDNEALAQSMTSPRFALSMVVAAVSMSGFSVQERRSSNPIVRPGLLASRGVWLVVLLSIGAGMCEAALVFTAGYAVALFEVKSSTAGFMFLPLAASIALASPVLGQILDRVGPRTMVTAGAIVLCAGLTLFSITTTRPMFYTGSVLIGIGQATLLGSSLNYVMLGAAPANERATAQGFITLALNLGIVVGSAMVGAIAASTADTASGFASAFRTMAVIAALIAAGGSAVRKPPYVTDDSNRQIDAA